MVSFVVDGHIYKCTCIVNGVSLSLSHSLQRKKKAEGPTDPQQPAKKRPPTIPETAATTTADVEALKQQIDAQGIKVRELKSSGAEKVWNA